MPSGSLLRFESNMLTDVERIIASHGQLNYRGKGRSGLGHITRSEVLMLCAAWELYIEEVMREGLGYFLSKPDSPKELLKIIQKELSSNVKNPKHELKPLELAGEGWKSSHINHAEEVLRGVSTPQSGNLNPLLKRF